MTAALITAAEAIKNVLNAGEFIADFEAERSYPDWNLELAEAKQLHVDVVPVGYVETALASRGSVGYQVTVDIGVRKKFGQLSQESRTGRIDVAEIDELILLVQQIHQYMCHQDRRVLAENVHWKETVITDAYVTKHLRELRQFTGLIRVNYNVHVVL